MSRVYVGNLDPRITEHELEDEVLLLLVTPLLLYGAASSLLL